jgi:hypothetical protein
MQNHRISLRLVAFVLVVAFFALARHERAWGQEAASPWGIASSGHSHGNYAEWLPRVSAIGVRSARIFPGWGSIEPKPGDWQWGSTDEMLKAAAANQVELTPCLMDGPGWLKDKVHALPMKHLDEWAQFIEQTVGHCKGQIHHWEVWNEVNGSFNANHDPVAAYAKLTTATYAAAKKADRDAQVGLSVASFDPAYLNQAIKAMADQGKPDSFDYLCIHPYEIADRLSEPDGEVPYLWMTHMTREMLAAAAPKRANAEIWITEISRHIGDRGHGGVSETEAAKGLVKLYVMAVAQGITRTEWFEAQDPEGEEAGYGLINRAGSERPSYKAFGTMTAQLGITPKYLGWLALCRSRRGYGFVFDGPAGAVLAAWAPKGTMADITLPTDCVVMSAVIGAKMNGKAGDSLSLTDSPVFITGLPAEWVTEAKSNSKRDFPWGGNFSNADAVSATLGGSTANDGLVQLDAAATPHCTFADGSTGVILRGDLGQSAAFYAHPSFASFTTHDYYVRVSVRRLAPGNVGMNLQYEAADRGSGGPYKNQGTWYSVPPGDGWHTHVWHVTDACLAKVWGYDISLRPEQSVPFVIGKVEVSKSPLK